MLANPYVILAAVLAFAGIVGGVGYKSYHMGADSVVARQARDDAVRMETLQLAQLGAAEAIAAIEVKNVTIKQRLETKLIQSPPDPRCVVDDGVLALTNEAITGRSDPTANSGVSGAGQNDGKDVP